MLKLEVTEHSLLEDMQTARITLSGLRDLGVSIAIDDFGTGRSNLHYLGELPVDTLKIDKSFIDGRLSDENNRNIVELILALSREIGFDVVAEGIEQNVDLDVLQTMNCDYGQGYLFAKPLPLTRALNFTRNWQAKTPALHELRDRA